MVTIHDLAQAQLAGTSQEEWAYVWKTARLPPAPQPHGKGPGWREEYWGRQRARAATKAEAIAGLEAELAIQVPIIAACYSTIADLLPRYLVAPQFVDVDWWSTEFRRFADVQDALAGVGAKIANALQAIVDVGSDPVLPKMWTSLGGGQQIPPGAGVTGPAGLGAFDEALAALGAALAALPPAPEYLVPPEDVPSAVHVDLDVSAEQNLRWRTASAMLYQVSAKPIQVLTPNGNLVQYPVAGVEPSLVYALVQATAPFYLAALRLLEQVLSQLVKPSAIGFDLAPWGIAAPYISVADVLGPDSGACAFTDVSGAIKQSFFFARDNSAYAHPQWEGVSGGAMGKLELGEPWKSLLEPGVYTATSLAHECDDLIAALCG